jgi:DNA polymerase-4
MHHKLVAAVESCTPVGQVRSIDEMVCPLMGSERQRDKALALAARIKRSVIAAGGECMRSSIGIAPNSFLAKLASNMQKPDGCTVIEATELPQVLYKLKLRDIKGVGKAMEARLRQHGIETVERLCSVNAATLRAAWGSIEGERMHAKLRGAEVIGSETRRASVSHSHVLPPEMRAEPAACSVLHRLLQKAATRLRSYGLIAGNVHLRLTYRDNQVWRADQRVDRTADTLVFLHAFEALWRQRPRRRAKLLAVGIALTDLDDAAHRMRDLFDATDDSHDKLNDAIDAINQRYGKNALYFGGAHRALAAAPMRIAFQHIPDLVEGD